MSFATCTACPLLKLKRSILLIMCNWVNNFYHVMNSKYSITLLFFGSNIRHASLLRPRPSIVSIASAIQRNWKAGSFHVNGFNSLGADTHMRTHTNFPDKSNFKKPGTHWPSHMAGLTSSHYLHLVYIDTLTIHIHLRSLFKYFFHNHLPSDF